MFPNDTQTEQDGQLPEPDATTTMQQLLRGSTSERPRWGRWLPAGLFSIGFHLFLAPLLVVITVSFGDHIVGISSWSANDGTDQLGNDVIIECGLNRENDEPAEVDRTVAAGNGNQPSQLKVPGKDKAEIHGTIVAVDDKVLTLKAEDGSRRSFQTDTNTVLSQDIGTGASHFPGGISSREVGQFVAVQYWTKDGHSFATLVELNRTARTAVLSKDEYLLLELINKYRVSQNVPPLVLNQKLVAGVHFWTYDGAITGPENPPGRTYFSRWEVGLTPQGVVGSLMDWEYEVIRNARTQYIGVMSGNGPNNKAYFVLVLAEDPRKTAKSQQQPILSRLSSARTEP